MTVMGSMRVGGTADTMQMRLTDTVRQSREEKMIAGPRGARRIRAERRGDEVAAEIVLVERKDRVGVVGRGALTRMAEMIVRGSQSRRGRLLTKIRMLKMIEIGRGREEGMEMTSQLLLRGWGVIVTGTVVPWAPLDGLTSDKDVTAPETVTVMESVPFCPLESVTRSVAVKTPLEAYATLGDAPVVSKTPSPSRSHS